MAETGDLSEFEALYAELFPDFPADYELRSTALRLWSGGLALGLDLGLEQAELASYTAKTEQMLGHKDRGRTPRQRQHLERLNSAVAWTKAEDDMVMKTPMQVPPGRTRGASWARRHRLAHGLSTQETKPR